MKKSQSTQLSSDPFIQLVTGRTPFAINKDLINNKGPGDYDIYVAPKKIYNTSVLKAPKR